MSDKGNQNQNSFISIENNFLSDQNNQNENENENEEKDSFYSNEINESNESNESKE